MEWISVIDYLPPKCEQVLVCGKDSTDNYVMAFAAIDCKDKKWYFLHAFDQDSGQVYAPYSDCGSILSVKDIQYWSELPEDPQPGYKLCCKDVKCTLKENNGMDISKKTTT